MTTTPAETVITYLDGYCERMGEAGIWAEPLNAVTNLCFIAAAIIAARQLKRTQTGFAVDLWLLVLFLFGIGIGSGLWHTYANAHTVLMDVIPITLFINAYLISSMRRLLRFNWWQVGAGWGAYIALTLLGQFNLPPDTMNGTIMYIPTFITLMALTLAIHRRDAVQGKIFVQALMVWTLSLTFRTVDLQVCQYFPYGTHFLWHTLNAWVLWRLLVVLIEQAAQATSSGGSHR